MDPGLYEAAAKGEIDPFNKTAKDHLGSIVTQNKNTVLHVNIASQTRKHNREGESISTKFVELILEMCPSLLLQVNAKGDAPLHVAAKCGQAAVVGSLIKFAKQQPHQELESGEESTARRMLGMKNDEENTALHEAVQSGSLDVVEILLKADPDFPYSANGSGETPLYLAAARGYEKISAAILLECPSPAHEGPSGKTALHAAACRGSFSVSKLLLNKEKSSTRERDRYGWTPLHYAAYLGRSKISKLLVETDKFLALIPDEDRKMTALHLAAARGYSGIVESIIHICPEYCELVDNRGWNVLHFAMVSYYACALKRLLKYAVVRNLIFEKDVNGNTPFHVLAAVCRRSDYVGYGIVPRKIAKGYCQAVNKQNISAEQVNRYGFPALEKEIEGLSKADGSGQYPEGVVKIRKNKSLGYTFWENLDEDVIGMEKASEFHLLVATLIATVTFAAAFTLPGGYKGEMDDGADRGSAILSTNTALQAFVVFDAIAMFLSISAVFFHFVLSLKIFKKFTFLFVFAFLFTGIAMGAMILAFGTGAYAVLDKHASGLAIITCIIGLTSFLLVIFMACMVFYKAKEAEFED